MLSSSGTDLTPTAAERVRTVLEAASSLVVTTWTSTTEIGRGPTYDADGSLVLDVPAEAPLAVELLGAEWPGLSVTVEVTDVAPVVLRDRVRARVTLTGTLGGALHGGHAPHEGWATRFQPRYVSLEEGGVTTDVEPDALAAAAPDPLARLEAEHLMHLDAHHPAAAAHLLHADGPHPRAGLAQVRPVRLDRYGLVLRVEAPGVDEDVGVPFDTPLVRADQLPDATRALLARAAAREARDPVSRSSTCRRDPSAPSGRPTPSRGPTGGRRSG